VIRYKGLFLPDGETHLVEWMEKAGQTLGGRPAYQLHKYRAAAVYAPALQVAVDVGAHVGQWTLAMLGDFSHVEAFEPVPAYAACFKANVAAELDRVRLHELALGDRPGRAGLCCPDPASHGDTFVAAEGDVPNAAQDIEVRTLDSFALPRVDFMKIDCEGYELRVLKGAEATLRRCRPALIVEQKPGRPQRHGLGQLGAVEYLQSLGAKLCKEMSGDFVLAWV
jgi:FkbM family methyltransferase